MKCIIAALCGVMLLAGLIAGCGSTQQTTTTEQLSTSTTVLVTTTAALVTTTTETIPLVGETTISDKAGDVADGNGAKPPEVTALTGRGDLSKVTMKADGTDIILTFDNAAPPPSHTEASPLGGDEYILWYVTTKGSNGDWQYQLKAKLIGDKWSLSMFNAMTAMQSDSVGEPTIAGNSLSVSFPIEMMPLLSEATGWWAGTEWSKGAITYEDVAPDGGIDSPAKLPWK